MGRRAASETPAAKQGLAKTSVVKQDL